MLNNTPIITTIKCMLDDIDEMLDKSMDAPFTKDIISVTLLHIESTVRWCYSIMHASKALDKMLNLGKNYEEGGKDA